MRPRVRHRDWYLDEGAPGPMTGFMAAISGTVTSSVTGIKDHAHNMSNLKKGKYQKELENLESADLDPNAMRPLQSHPQLRPLSTYTPVALDNIAHKIAAESLPRRAKKPPRSLTLKPPRNRMHAVAREYAHFADEMTSTALKGNHIPCHCRTSTNYWS